MRSLRAMVVLSLAGLMALAALVSWYDRRAALEQAEAHVALTVNALRDHALNVFQTQELALDQITQRSAALDWGAIAGSGEFASFLSATRDRMSPVSSIWLADASGRVRAATGTPGAAAVIADATGDAGALAARPTRTIIGRPHLGTFALSRPRTSPDGGFDGLIAIETATTSLENFFRSIDENGRHRIVLIRADGTVLATDSTDSEPAQFPPTSELMRSIRQGVQRAGWNPTPDGGAHFFEWRQLGSYPLYIAYAIDRDVALRSWYGRVLLYGVLAAGGWAALSIIAYLATRRAAAEAALQQAQRMEAVGRLASGVAHDFNNLLTTVIGNVERIALDLQATPRVHQLAETALSAARRGASLTTQLLAFARRQPLNPSLVRIEALVDAMLPLIEDAIGETVTVSFTGDPDLPAIRIDPGQFEAALLNLALNARDAMPQGGRIRIEARSASLDAAEARRRALRPGDYVVVEIVDTGVGMAKEVASRAFEPFFSTKETGKGSGLGLSMVYGFARQSGGTAEIESRLGAGTTVRLFIPRADQAPPADAPAVADAPSSARRVAVLIVEDQEGVRQLMADSLEERGHEVKTAGTADHAVEILSRDGGIEVLVTDIILPGGMTGADLVRKARELTPDLKILTVSGNATEDSIKALQSDGCAFLPKPFRPSDLARAVDALL